MELLLDVLDDQVSKTADLIEVSELVELEELAVEEVGVVVVWIAGQLAEFEEVQERFDDPEGMLVDGHV